VRDRAVALEEAKAEVRAHLGLADSEKLDEQGWQLVRTLARHNFRLHRDARPAHQLLSSLGFAATLLFALYCSWLTGRGELDWTTMLAAVLLSVAYGFKLGETLRTPLYLVLLRLERLVRADRARLAPKAKGRRRASGVLDSLLRENPEAVADAFRELATDGQGRPSQADVAERLGVSDDTLRRASKKYEIPWPPV